MRKAYRNGGEMLFKCGGEKNRCTGREMEDK